MFDNPLIILFFVLLALMFVAVLVLSVKVAVLQRNVLELDQNHANHINKMGDRLNEQHRAMSDLRERLRRLENPCMYASLATQSNPITVTPEEPHA